MHMGGGGTTPEPFHSIVLEQQETADMFWSILTRCAIDPLSSFFYLPGLVNQKGRYRFPGKQFFNDFLTISAMIRIILK